MKLATLLGAASLSVLALAPIAQAQDAELTVLDYPGFELPEFHQAYVDAHGASPTFSFFGDEEEAFQKVRAGFESDITSICAGSVPKWQESGIIEPWDTSRIAGYASLDANLLGEQAEGEEVFFIPTYFGTTAIAYNPDEVPEEDVSTLNVFRDPKYQGRVSIPDNVDDAWALAYLATGVTSWDEVDEAATEAAAQWLREVHPNLRTYWVDPAELAQLMATGEVVIAWAWNETYPTMREEGRPIAFQRAPQEGTSVWLCGAVNMADAPGSEDKLYDYLNAFLSAESVPALVANGFGSANAVALNDQMTPEDLEQAGLGQVDTPLFAQTPIPIAMREQHAELFEQIKAGF
jgi:spermidine/putrescine transport system substrate-binding protein